MTPELVDKPLSKECSLNLTIDVENKPQGLDVERVIEGVATDEIEVLSSSDSSIEVRMPDRVWWRRPWMIAEHVRDEYALNLMDDYSVEPQDTREVAEENVSATIEAVGNSQESAEMILEVELTKATTESKWENMWSKHILRSDSIQTIFPEPRRMNEESYLLAGATGRYDVWLYMESYTVFREMFNVSDSTLTCRAIE